MLARARVAKIMAGCGDLLDRCPCLAGLLKPRHANRELESVALVGGGQSPDPDTEAAPSAAAAAWSGFQKIQASVTSTVLGAPDELEPSWQLLCKGATMRLDGPTGPGLNASTALKNELCHLVLTADHALLTWKTVRLAQSMPVASGAVAMSSVSVEAAARGWFSAPDERALVIIADGQARALPPPSPRHACPLYHARRLASAADSQPDCGERGAEGGVGRSTQGGRGARFGRQAHAQARAQHAAGVRDAGEEARGGASQGGGHGRLHERHETHRARDGLSLVVELFLLHLTRHATLV